MNDRMIFVLPLATMDIYRNSWQSLYGQKQLQNLDSKVLFRVRWFFLQTFSTNPNKGRRNFIRSTLFNRISHSVATIRCCIDTINCPWSLWSMSRQQKYPSLFGFSCMYFMCGAIRWTHFLCCDCFWITTNNVAHMYSMLNCERTRMP